MILLQLRYVPILPQNRQTRWLPRTNQWSSAGKYGYLARLGTPQWYHTRGNDNDWDLWVIESHTGRMHRFEKFLILIFYTDQNGRGGVFPDTEVRHCVIHQFRNNMKYVASNKNKRPSWQIWRWSSPARPAASATGETRQIWPLLFTQFNHDSRSTTLHYPAPVKK